MSSTPRTDTFLIEWDFAPELKRIVEHARTLERELNAANAELARLRAGGCARNQKTTQFCAEAVELQDKLDKERAYSRRLEEAGDWFAENSEPSAWINWESVKETRP